MARISDAGVSSSGNWIKPEILAEDCRIFQLVNATYREKRPGSDYPAQVDFTAEFLDAPEGAGSDEITFRFSLGHNDVRQKFIDWFATHPDEPINGVERESGLVLYKGMKRAKGNPPFLFRDPTEEELSIVRDSHDQPHNPDDIPF